MFYQDVARLVLNSDSPFVLLSSAHIQTKSWSLPSWVPLWHENAPRTLRPFRPHPQFRCADGSRIAPQIKISNTGRDLLVYGLVLERIKVVPGFPNLIYWITSQSGSIFPSHYRKRNSDWQGLLCKIGSREGALESFAMTLTCGTDHSGYLVNNVSSHLADFAVCFESPQFNWSVLDNIPQRKERRGNPNKDSAGEEFERGEGKPRILLCRVGATLANHTMFSTESGLLGMGPSKSMEDGDLVCVLFGADVPFLLGPTYDGGYLVVGECYMYDIMHGEVLDRLEDPDSQSGTRLEPTWLKLV